MDRPHPPVAHPRGSLGGHRPRPHRAPLEHHAMYNVDIAVQQVKIAEGALTPTLSAVGNVQRAPVTRWTIARERSGQARVAARCALS